MVTAAVRRAAGLVARHRGVPPDASIRWPVIQRLRVVERERDGAADIVNVADASEPRLPRRAAAGDPAATACATAVAARDGLGRWSLSYALRQIAQRVDCLRARGAC